MLLIHDGAVLMCRDPADGDALAGRFAVFHVERSQSWPAAHWSGVRVRISRAWMSVVMSSPRAW